MKRSNQRDPIIPFFFFLTFLSITFLKMYLKRKNHKRVLKKNHKLFTDYVKNKFQIMAPTQKLIYIQNKSQYPFETL